MAVKVIEVALAGTVAAAGTPRLPVLLVRETTAPPVRATELREIVQVAVPAPVIVVGEHDKALNWGTNG